MSNSTASNAGLNFFSQKEDDKEPFKGVVTFTDRTISFNGTTILSKNVAKYEQYGVKRVNKISIKQMIVFSFVAIASYFLETYGKVFSVVLLGVVAYGIYERVRKLEYGLTIELNSGTRHYFIHKDRAGIESLFKLITEAIESETPLRLNAKFENSKVIIGNTSGPIHMGSDTHHHNYSEV